MRDLKLSICIPTYNRGNLLNECLSSFIHQIIEEGLEDKIEIVVSDNGSSDDTQVVVESQQKVFRSVVYSKNATNMGFDKNVEKVFSLAKGEYVWFFSDDDWIKEGSIKLIYELLTTNDIGAMVINWQCYDRNSKATKSDLVKLEYPVHKSLNEFLLHVGSTFYLSSLMFKKCLVGDGDIREYHDPPGFMHYGIFLNAAAHSSACALIAEPVVCYRAGDDVGYLGRWPEVFLNDMPEFLCRRAKELGISKKAIDHQLKNYVNRVTLLTILRVRSIFKRSFIDLAKVLRRSFTYYGRYIGYYLFIVPAFIVPLPALRCYRYFKGLEKRSR